MNNDQVSFQSALSGKRFLTILTLKLFCNGTFVLEMRTHSTVILVLTTTIIRTKVTSTSWRCWPHFRTLFRMRVYKAIMSKKCCGEKNIVISDKIICSDTTRTYIYSAYALAKHSLG